MTEREIATLARSTFAEVHQLVTQHSYDEAEAVIRKAIATLVEPDTTPKIPAYAHLTPETRALVEALHQHRDAVDTLLETEQQVPRSPRSSISRVLNRAIARLVLLDTRFEALKRRKPDTRPATAADRPKP